MNILLERTGGMRVISTAAKNSMHAPKPHKGLAHINYYTSLLPWWVKVSWCVFATIDKECSTSISPWGSKEERGDTLHTGHADSFMICNESLIVQHAASTSPHTHMHTQHTHTHRQIDDPHLPPPRTHTTHTYTRAHVMQWWPAVHVIQC